MRISASADLISSVGRSLSFRQTHLLRKCSSERSRPASAPNKPRSLCTDSLVTIDAAPYRREGDRVRVQKWAIPCWLEEAKASGLLFRDSIRAPIVHTAFSYKGSECDYSKHVERM